MNQLFNLFLGKRARMVNNVHPYPFTKWYGENCYHHINVFGDGYCLRVLNRHEDLHERLLEILNKEAFKRKVEFDIRDVNCLPSELSQASMVFPIMVREEGGAWIPFMKVYFKSDFKTSEEPLEVLWHHPSIEEFKVTKDKIDFTVYEEGLFGHDSDSPILENYGYDCTKFFNVN